MANVRAGNTLYIDSTGTVHTGSCNVYYVTLTSTGANAVVALQDPSNSANKINLKLDAAYGTQLFDFSSLPLFFGGGIAVSTITNAIVTIVYNERGG